jgi:hypothetical protein
MRRQNVSVTDPINTGFKVQRGEQLTRGSKQSLQLIYLINSKLLLPIPTRLMQK